jgi:hypothetical protein
MLRQKKVFERKQKYFYNDQKESKPNVWREILKTPFKLQIRDQKRIGTKKEFCITLTQ